MPEIDRAWAGGLFEGEGSTFINTKLHMYISPVMSLGLTDADILEKFHAILRVGDIRYYDRQHDHWKDMWKWSTNTFEHTQYSSAYLWPYLGPRRRAQITTTAQKYHSYVIRLARDKIYREANRYKSIIDEIVYRYHTLGQTRKEIAEALNISVNTVYRAMKREGIKTRPNGRGFQRGEDYVAYGSRAKAK